MEKAFRYELASIPGFEQKTFPITAPENTPAPFMAYVLNPGVNDRSLTSILASKRIDGELLIVCATYSALHDALDLVVNKINSFTQREIGGSSKVFVTEAYLDDQPDESIDSKTGEYRAVIDFVIHL